MTKHLNLHFFTPEQLHIHDVALATEVSHVVTKHVLDQVQHMKPSQIVNASRFNGKILHLPPDDISDIVSAINQKRKERFGTE
jgi:hypothetical protein